MLGGFLKSRKNGERVEEGEKGKTISGSTRISKIKNF